MKRRFRPIPRRRVALGAFALVALVIGVVAWRSTLKPIDPRLVGQWFTRSGYSGKIYVVQFFSNGTGVVQMPGVGSERFVWWVEDRSLYRRRISNQWWGLAIDQLEMVLSAVTGRPRTYAWVDEITEPANGLIEDRFTFPMWDAFKCVEFRRAKSDRPVAINESARI